MKIIEIFQDTQPISYTGFFTHTSAWLFSSFSDVIYPNPNFNQFASKPITIYCIHGTADRVSSFTKIATRMLNSLPSNIAAIRLVSFNQRGLGKGIESYAQQLANKIKENGDKTVILLGHSRGGLVAAYFAEYLAEKESIAVQSVMAICTPFKGSDAAIFPLTWFSESIKQMERNSPFLNDLVEKMQHSKINYYYFSARNDGLVTSESTWVKKEAILLERHGHVSIMSSNKLIVYLKNYINDLSKSFSQNNNEDETLANICYKIDEQVEKIKNRRHLKSSLEKQRAFINLKIKLWERFNHIVHHYPEAQTIGEFIQAFLKDDVLSLNTTCYAIFNEPLNYPFSFLHSNKSDSMNFLESLLKQYQLTLLPPFKTTLQLESAPSTLTNEEMSPILQA